MNSTENLASCYGNSLGCQEGICGTCGLVINGIAHGSQHLTAACPNAFASLFVSAKIAHLALLTQRRSERKRRAY